MRRNNFLSLAVLFLLSSFHILSAQNEPKSISLKKGEVLDILLLQQRPDTKPALQSYFQVAFPIAKKMSYTPLPGFRVMDNVNGNLLPESLILGKWNDIAIREQFLVDILNDVPDFHERRRTIWSYFGVTYFEMKEDISFQTNPEKTYFASAFWLKNTKKEDQILKEILASLESNGGHTLLSLQDGQSPTGYSYDPTFVILSEWDTAEDFERFQQAVQILLAGNISHINEFSLQ